MQSPYLTTFSKSILTALFAGIVATVLCLVLNIIYREHTHFPLASYINVSSLIFAVNLLFVVFGIVYYGFVKAFKRADLAFAVLFVIITVLCSLGAEHIRRSDVPQFNMEFHQLLLATVVIIGLTAAVGIPVLYHSRKFEEHVL